MSNNFNNRTDNYNSPCRPDCPDRDPYCHTKCEKYIEFREERNAQLEERIKEIDQIDYICSHIANKRDRMAIRRKMNSKRKIFTK